MSHRLYLGNLDKQVSEEDIKQLFSERDLAVDNVQLKAGYAFVDCQDQTTVDSAIDKLAGMPQKLCCCVFSLRTGCIVLMI